MNRSILLLILIVLIIILVIKNLSKEPFGKKVKNAFGGKKKKKKKKKFDKDAYDESRKFVDELLWSKINTIDDIEINNQIMTNIDNIVNFID